LSTAAFTAFTAAFATTGLLLVLLRLPFALTMAGGTGTVGAWRLEMGRFTTALLILYYCFTTAFITTALLQALLQV
jgi:hypothetical protein